VLLVQRPESAARWGNLWEFPHGPVNPAESHEEAAVRLARGLTGLEVALEPELLTLRHGVTRFRITMTCFEAEHKGGEFRSDFYRQGVWLPPAELTGYPVSSPQRRLAKALVAPVRQRTLF
jgi:A/G-specific adenine glycosylase